MKRRKGTKLYINTFSKISLLAVMLILLFACKNTSMDGMFKDYNKKFLPAEDVFWTTEYVTKATMDFGEYKLQSEYRVSKDTGLFIIGAPRDCDTYTWFLDGRIISANQVLELRISNKKPNTEFNNSESSVWLSAGSIKFGKYSLYLVCRKGSSEKEWRTNLVIW